MAEIVLALVPLLALLASLLLGHYPGCEAILKLGERIASRWGRSAGRRESRPIAPEPKAVSGGLLIALGLAQRPPPLLS